jgi:hypothetical protein
MTKRTCPHCGGRKGFYAKACRACSPSPKGWVGHKGPNHPAWKGGFMFDRDGYIKTYAPDHPWPRKSGYVLEHVRIMELSIGRRLGLDEIVHHMDNDRKNNAFENLEIMTRGEHSSLHRREDTHLRRRDSSGRFAGGIGGAICPNV